MTSRLLVAAALLLALLLLTDVPGGHAVPSWRVWQNTPQGTYGAATCSSTCPAKVKPGGDWVKDCLTRECAGQGKVKVTVNAGKAGCDWSNIILTPTSPSLASSCVLRVEKSSTVQVIATALPCGTYDILIKQGTYNACPLGAYLDSSKCSKHRPTACTQVGEVPKTGTGLWGASGKQWCEIASVNLCKDDSTNDLDAKCNDGNVCTTDSNAPNCACTYTNNAASCSNPTWPNGVVDDCKNGGQCSGGVCTPRYKPTTQSCTVTPIAPQVAACIYGYCTATGTCPTLFKDSSTNCGSGPTDSCDAQDTCGTSAEGKLGQCVDRLVTPNTPCKATLTSQGFRPLASCCDAPDVCDGTRKSCPDVFQNSSVPCLTVKEIKAGSCQDVTYNCKGTSATCNYRPPAGFLATPSR